jgi:hypothetical protein
MDNTPACDRKQNSMAPFRHYLGIYGALDPVEIARRCALGFDADASAFALRIMGDEYLAAFPDFRLTPLSGGGLDGSHAKLLFLRYLCEGRYCAGLGTRVAYDGIPWGNVYYRNFRGRCVNRLARVFGGDAAALDRVMGQNPGLRAEKLVQGDAGYSFEFMNGLYMSVIIWEGDGEFPASAQILFSDNFEFAFTAEDIAVAAELAIDVLSRMKG